MATFQGDAVNRRPSWLDDPHPSIDEVRLGTRGLRRALGLFGRLVPSERLRTVLWRGLVAKPRKLLRRAATGFYRIDHVYDVLEEFATEVEGPLSVLEFGTAQGYASAKILYAIRHLGLEDRVTFHGFDSFEGLPEAERPEDRGFRGNDWIKGSYRASLARIEAYCAEKNYRNARFHAGYFEDTLTPELLEELRTAPPCLVWLDCDLYSSTRLVLERLAPILPTGCVLYFDDVDFNHRSRFTGQARLIHEVNHGLFGEDIELVLDRELSWDSDRIYRWIRVGERASMYRPRFTRTDPPRARPIGDGSPFP